MHITMTWEQTTRKLEAVFAERGLQVVRSFDLQLARQAMRNPSACTCPHHGTVRCTCQYLVYLVYADGPEPVAVIVHGHDGHTEVTIDGSDEGALHSAIRQTLKAPAGAMMGQTRSDPGKPV